MLAKDKNSLKIELVNSKGALTENCQLIDKSEFLYWLKILITCIFFLLKQIL